MAERPSWWTLRERVATRIGPLFWPAWYLAPSSSRRRWEAMAEAMESAAWAEDPVGVGISVLRAHGYDVVRLSREA